MRLEPNVAIFPQAGHCCLQADAAQRADEDSVVLMSLVNLEHIFAGVVAGNAQGGALQLQRGVRHWTAIAHHPATKHKKAVVRSRGRYEQGDARISDSGGRKE